MKKKFISIVIALAMTAAVPLAYAADFGNSISDVSVEDGAIKSMTVDGEVQPDAIGIAAVYQNGVLVNAETSAAATGGVFSFSDLKVGAGQTYKAFLWNKNMLSPYAAAFDSTKGIPSGSGWNFNSIAAGTVYESGSVIEDAQGREMTVTAADFDKVNPTIKERAAGDNYLEFNDESDGSTGQRQDSWQIPHAAISDGDAVVYTMDVKKSNLEKDTILLRVYDTTNTTAENSYSTDGRSFELKTGDNGALALADYYSADDKGKAAQQNVSGFTYSTDKWFSVRVEYIRAENKVNVYAGDTADSVELKSTFTLGTLGTNNKTVPALSPDKLSCHTPGGGKVVLGVDNIDITTISYKAQNVPVSGTIYTTYSDDMKNKPELFTEGGATVVFSDGAGKEVEAAVGADGTYSAELMSNASYTVSVKGADKYTLSPLSGSFSIGIKELKASKDILLVNNLGEVAYKDTLEVGADKEYNTINKALSAVRKMTREDGQTVTIKIDPGTYEEQLYIDVNDIALVAAEPENKPVIQWYYGIGYVYYSAVPAGISGEGWYNADYAVAKIKKSPVKNWGATIRTTAKGFLAENLDVINTFNKYITDAEIADGVEPGGDSRKDFDRSNKNTGVKSKTATERAAAIFAGGSEIELYNCYFSSSQDTFGTGAASMYVKNCDIAGNTDYICGGNNCYFENCNLIWTGYSDTATGGYITACKTSKLPPEDKGYYFKDCVIKNSNESGMKFAPGSFGRTWGGLNCQVVFDNTFLDGVDMPNGWSSMGKDENKELIPVSKINVYVINGVNGVDYSSNKSYNPYKAYSENLVPEDFFGGWEPKHYVVDSSLIALKREIEGSGSVVFEVDGRAVTRAAEGTKITVKATPANNYELGSITVKTASGSDVSLDDSNSFIMPSEEITAKVVFTPKTLGKYTGWIIGEQSSGSGDGVAENVTYEGVDALHIISKNVYMPLEAPVASGKVTFDFDIYIDTTIPRNFRVYLENEVGTWQNTEAVMAEVINNRGNQVNTGPAIDSSTNPLFTYEQLGASGWVHFTITMDYSKASAGDFITITAQKADGSELGTKSMGVISGEDTTLKSIRFVTTATSSYYANMSLKTE